MLRRLSFASLLLTACHANGVVSPAVPSPPPQAPVVTATVPSPTFADDEVCVKRPTPELVPELSRATVLSASLVCREWFQWTSLALADDRVLVTLFDGAGKRERGTWLLDVSDTIQQKSLAPLGSASWVAVDRAGHRHVLIGQGETFDKTEYRGISNPLRYELDGVQQPGPPGKYNGVLHLAAGNDGTVASVLYADGGGLVLARRERSRWTTARVDVRSVAFDQDGSLWTATETRVTHGRATFDVPAKGTFGAFVPGADPVALRDGNRVRWLASGKETAWPAPPKNPPAALTTTPTRVQSSEDTFVWMGIVADDPMFAVFRKNIDQDQVMAEFCQPSDGVHGIEPVPHCESHLQAVAVRDWAELLLYRARAGAVTLAGRVTLAPSREARSGRSMYMPPSGFPFVSARGDKLALAWADREDGFRVLVLDVRKLAP